MLQDEIIGNEEAGQLVYVGSWGKVPDQQCFDVRVIDGLNWVSFAADPAPADDEPTED